MNFTNINFILQTTYERGIIIVLILYKGTSGTQRLSQSLNVIQWESWDVYSSSVAVESTCLAMMPVLSTLHPSSPECQSLLEVLFPLLFTGISWQNGPPPHPIQGVQHNVLNYIGCGFLFYNSKTLICHSKVSMVPISTSTSVFFLYFIFLNIVGGKTIAYIIAVMYFHSSIYSTHLLTKCRT